MQGYTNLSLRSALHRNRLAPTTNPPDAEADTDIDIDMEEEPSASESRTPDYVFAILTIILLRLTAVTIARICHELLCLVPLVAAIAVAVHSCSRIERFRSYQR